MKIHSVLRGWVDFNSSDPARVQKGLAMSEDGLRAAQGFGADAMFAGALPHQRDEDAQAA